MMSLAPKKDGGPNTKFFESPETISLFDAIKSWLQKNCKKVRFVKPIRRALLNSWLTCMYSRLSFVELWLFKILKCEVFCGLGVELRFCY
jgi:hypothetical protein